MILVFASFIFGGEQAIMQMGLGFAAAGAPVQPAGAAAQPSGVTATANGAGGGGEE